MLLAHKDGQMRLLSGATVGYWSGVTQYAGCTYYFEILFTDANFSAPTTRKKTEERLVMDRGLVDSHAHYVQSAEDPIMEPLPLTISCKINDTTSGVSYLDEWFRSGKVNNRTVASTKGNTYNVSGVSNPIFVDTTKRTYHVECIWDGTVDLGFEWAEVYFPPGEQTIAEGEDGITLNLSGQIYGTIKRIAAFTSGTSVVDVTA